MPESASTSSTSSGTRGSNSPAASRFPPSSYSRGSDVGSGPPTGNGGSSNASSGHGSQQGHGSPSNNGRTSNESRRGFPSVHHRSQSLISGGHASERASSVDGNTSPYSSKMSVFDELLESGGTMKVSLTPDRMKTFDVCIIFSHSSFLQQTIY